MTLRIFSAVLTAIFGFLSSPLVSWPNEKELEASKCHFSPNLGGYHCHRGPLAWHFFSSKEEMLHLLEQSRINPGAPPTTENRPPSLPSNGTPKQPCGQEEGPTPIVCGNGIEREP